MNRIITFGCSFTYGHGLRDCINAKLGPGKYPSKFAWPNLIAQKLNKENVNMAYCGASNKHIAHLVDNFQFHETDICLIQWTFIDRYTIFLQDNSIQSINAHSKTKDSKNYYKMMMNLYNLYDKSIDIRLLLNGINYKLKNKNVKTINFSPIKARDKFSNDQKSFEDLVKFDFSVDKNNIGFLPDIDVGLDNWHPGPKTHKQFAEYVLEEYPWLKK